MTKANKNNKNIMLKKIKYKSEKSLMGHCLKKIKLKIKYKTIIIF